MHDLGGNLARGGAYLFDGLGHLHDQRIAVHEGAGEGRNRGVAAQDGRGKVDDAAHEVRGRFVVSARADHVGAFDEGVRRTISRR